MNAGRLADRVAVLGIRHHGPGSARSVLNALEDLDPDVVLVEGPPELDVLVRHVGDPGLRPPVAGLAYAVDEPRRALFYPLAAFSPEWVALRWAVSRGCEVRFADLPAAHQLAPGARAEPGGAPPYRPDAIGTLARAAGYDDPERWWEDAVEHRSGSSLAHFDAVREAMTEVRGQVPDAGHDTETLQREAAMRRVVRAVLKAGARQVAFVCGAYHAPAVHPDAFPPASHDSRLLAGLPRAKVAATWAPWTAKRLAVASGYGAGVTSPGWYEHLFTTWQGGERDVTTGWLVKVARALRDARLDTAPASVVEAVRLADALAALRGRPSVGLAELTDAARTVMAEGSDVPLLLVDRSLVVGEALGSVPESVPVVPLAADLARQQKALRLKPSATETAVQLDLRREPHRARSRLFHRLVLLEVPWAEQVDAGASTGTFKEAWRLEWRPELAVDLVEAGLYGTTIEAAAVAKVAERAETSEDLPALSRLVEACLVAELPAGQQAVLDAVADRAARQHDVLALLGTVEPLARTRRYGDVRGVDTSQVERVLRTLVARASVGLRAACAALDDDAAVRMREAVGSAHRGVRLLDDAFLAEPWRAALRAVAADPRVHGAVSGRTNRLLLDWGDLPVAEAGRRLSRRLSSGAPAPAGAAWLDGFLEGEALLLLHDDDLLRIVDEWVSGVDEATFEDLLPLLRRSFARHAPAERRQVGDRLRGIDTPGHGGAGPEIDVELAMPAVRTLARLMGLEPAS